MITEKRKVDWKSKFTKDQILTIPNILSFFRIMLIPIIIYFYCVIKSPFWALMFIFLSTLTDMVDGFIARRYNMMTDFGKFIDPIADKATQAAILICLVFRFKLMLLPLILMLIKEAFLLTSRIHLFRKTEKVLSARWHGKLNTTILYIMICMHVIWFNIDSVISDISIYICTVSMLFSAILYFIETLRHLKKKKS